MFEYHRREKTSKKEKRKNGKQKIEKNTFL